MRAVLTFCLLLLGCTGPASSMRSATYGPSFTYIKPADVRSEMWSLAADVRAIDTALRQETPPAAGELAEVLRHMEATVETLRGRGGKTNHERLDKTLDLFARDVTGAREAVEVEPANYFLAGAIAGSCLYCHR